MGIMGLLSKFGLDASETWWWDNDTHSFNECLGSTSRCCSWNNVCIWTYRNALKGYQGTVLPILLVIFLMSVIERNVRKIIPNMLDILLTPLITVLATGFLALVVVEPIANWGGDGISVFLQFAINNFGIFAGIIFGGLYSAIVISGIHHSFHAIELGLISSTGFNTLLPIWAVANFAQGGAALPAIAITTSDTMLNYCIGLVIAGVVSFVATWIMGVKEEA